MVLMAAAAAILSFPISQGYPLKLKFVQGEQIRYKTSITISDKRGPVSMAMKGSHMVSIRVGSISNGKATMSVSYSDEKATATVTGLPKEAQPNKSKIESEAATGLKNSLSGGGRTQTVSATGRTTYYLKNAEGKTITLHNGAFMMASLPDKAPAMNEKWTAKVAFPDENAGPPLNITYKLVGVVTVGSERAYKVTLSSTDSRTQTRNELTMKSRIDISGHVLIGSTSGKVHSGEFSRAMTLTMTPKGQPSQTAKTTISQTFTRI